MALLRVTCAALLVVTAVGSAARAETVSAFTSFWAVGDSLSDPGNLYAATGSREPPSPPYFEGRFSSGPVWAEDIAGDFEAQGLATGNVAFGGARALANADVVPDLPTQIGLVGAISAGQLGLRPLLSMWIGANDLVFEGVPSGEARRVGRAAARAVGDGARALSTQGFGDILMFNQPDLAGTPLFALGGSPAAQAQARAGSRAFNATLARQVAKLERDGVGVIRIDTAGLFRALIDDPQAFGVANATIPCLAPGRPPCGPDVAPLLAFYDPLHPNAVIHGAIADEVRKRVAPVPLPAPAMLLLVAVAGLAAVRRVRARASA